MRGAARFALAFLAWAAVALAQAQTIPQCAAPCIVNGIKEFCSNAPNMTACMCGNDALQQSATACIMSSCTMKEALVAKNVTSTTCGVEIHDVAGTYAVISIILAVISFSMAAARLAFKLTVTRHFSADDYAMIAVLLIAIPCVLVTHYGTTANGVGRDIWTLTPENITSFLYHFWWMAVLYFALVSLVKLCLLLFYLRIFPSQGVRRLLWGTVVFDVLFGVAYVFLAIFQCTPISHYWEMWHGEKEGKCLSRSAIAWSNAAISIILDFWMLAIPLSQLRSLNLHWKKKIGVALMFGVGTFITIVSIIRLQALIVFAQSSNATYDNYPVSLWSTVEINVGIIVCCLPSLRLILVRIFPSLGSHSNYGPSYPNSGAGGPNSSNRLRASQGRRTGNLTAKSNKSGHLQSEADSDPSKPLEIVRQQTFVVKYDDDDETSLVHMRGLDFGAHSQKSDDSRLR
ncbi:hypothetical protein VTJ83DRAFT_6976 [Remersonia thermophila]|uniref:CFEM domain-containing protein n=1 Tax=Remersonia thermophila TaxID=72144 RepID=A0ABR4D6C0_9PEZI